ncbi:MAG TPA: hypothetical protein VGK34_00865 [Armatimonadota bacterium]|jgi:hypothetical protein
MTKEVMRRSASDNVYLHKDFHGALSRGIDYLESNFGAEAVREYLRTFTLSFYAPLIEDLEKRGLVALKEHFENVYAIESGKAHFELSDDELIIQVEACPAVMHMRENGYKVADLFYETTRTVNEALCEGSPFEAELLSYDQETGQSKQRFSRRKK